MTRVDTTGSVDEQAVLQAIKMQGDGLWNGRMSDAFDGHYVGLRDPGPPRWSLLYRCIRLADKAPEWSQGGILIVGFVLLGPIDLLQMPLRLLLLPVLQVIWLLERAVGKMLRRSFFCPICHNSMSEPYVFCRACNRVQGKLYPQFGSLLFKTCPECVRVDRKNKSSWKTLGNFVLSPPHPLICRDTQESTGCYRPHRLSSVAGKHSTSHIVVTGVSIRTKHTVLAHIIRHTTSGQEKRVYKTVWQLSELEAKLAKLRLWKSLYEDTSSYERIGQRYTLARTFVLQRGRKLLALHNLCHSWLGSEERLFTDGVSWRQVSGLILVVDVYMLRQGIKEAVTSHVELYSRLVRVIEKDYPLLPGTKLPLKVAVVMPVAENDVLGRSADMAGALDAETVASIIAQETPEFHALCRRSVSPRNVRFFGGTIPTADSPSAGRWVGAVLEWMS